MQPWLARRPPYPVFAPTNEAFAAAGIDPASVWTLAELQTVLLYHVVSGDYMLVHGCKLAESDVMTLEGRRTKRLEPNAEGGVTFNEAGVTQARLGCLERHEFM